jgi:1,4-alpha-glucan branching enzyme
LHQGLQGLVKDLNHLYHNSKALYQYDFNWQGFEWIDCNDANNSVLVFIRKSEDDIFIVALNMTPVPRHNYRIGLLEPGHYEEIFNSDAECYGGSNVGNGEMPLMAEEKPWMDRPYSMPITLPPLAGIILKQPKSEKINTVNAKEKIKEKAPILKAVVKKKTTKRNTRRK